MKSWKSDIFLIIVLIIVSVALAFVIPIKNESRLLSLLPNVLGILLTGILASLSIIFGLLSSRDLAQLKADFCKDGKDLYISFAKKVKFDAIIIFSSLVLSIIVFVMYDIELLPIELEIQKRAFFAIDLTILIFSLSTTYDIISSLFYLNELRYELSNINQEK